MAKQAYVYSGTDWVPLASEVTNLSSYQTKALNQFPNRNIIINGDMKVAQRATSVSSITSGGYLTADRWNEGITTQGTWTISVENDAPTGSGFRKSLKMLCTTADASPAAADNIQFFQPIEGQNLQHIKKGTASAEQLTISFWVKSNVTGTYIVNLYDNDNARIISKSYTISSSGVWEYKTINIPADTTGAFDNDNNLSLYVIWGLGAGSNMTSGTLATTWQSAVEANRYPGQTNLASATNNYWQVTGVQLEVGDTATPFEFKPYAQVLAECQRYYYRMTSGGNNYARFGQGHVGAGTSTQFYGATWLPVTMRANATSVDFSTLCLWNGGTVFPITNVVIENVSPEVPTLQYTSSGLTQYTAMMVMGNASSAAYLGINAEL